MVEVLNTILGEIHGVMEKVKEDEMKGFMDKIEKSRRLFVSGEGRSGFSARGFAMRMMHLGYTVYFVGETITPTMKEGDVWIGVSGSGSSASVINDAKKAKKAGCTVLAVTSKRQSPLAEAAEKVLLVPGTVKADAGSERGSVQLLSSLFDQSLHIVLDAICLLISYRDEVTNEEAVKAHW
ncbi:MAG: 6-phospho-3-hexuloisomerase [Eubacteriales bacterium]|nr:6-phospho-3-hexuloisomerase [Eubacteriales bacterium]